MVKTLESISYVLFRKIITFCRGRNKDFLETPPWLKILKLWKFWNFMPLDRRKCNCEVKFLLNIYWFLSISHPPSFWCKQKSGEDEIQLSLHIGGMHFFRSFFFCRRGGNKDVYLPLITNPSLYENVNLFEHDMEI